jgi:hypothetical protein
MHQPASHQKKCARPCRLRHHSLPAVRLPMQRRTPAWRQDQWASSTMVVTPQGSSPTSVIQAAMLREPRFQATGNRRNREPAQPGTGRTGAYGICDEVGRPLVSSPGLTGRSRTQVSRKIQLGRWLWIAGSQAKAAPRNDTHMIRISKSLRQALSGVEHGLPGKSTCIGRNVTLAVNHTQQPTDSSSKASRSQK